jgi:hypothetical protein
VGIGVLVDDFGELEILSQPAGWRLAPMRSAESASAII